MNLHVSTAARRILAAAAVTCAAALTPAAALAAPGSQAGAAPAATTPPCATSGLDVWLNTQGSGASGKTFYFLEFTNLSGRSCHLFGYPGVSGVTLSGTQIGRPAARYSNNPHTVTLANGATTHALVGVVNAGVIPPAQCHPVTASGLRVYPPNQTQSRVVPYPFPACSTTGPIYLLAGPVGFP